MKLVCVLYMNLGYIPSFNRSRRMLTSSNSLKSIDILRMKTFSKINKLYTLICFTRQPACRERTKMMYS